MYIASQFEHIDFWNDCNYNCRYVILKTLYPLIQRKSGSNGSLKVALRTCWIQKTSWTSQGKPLAFQQSCSLKSGSFVQKVVKLGTLDLAHIHSCRGLEYTHHRREPIMNLWCQLHFLSTGTLILGIWSVNTKSNWLQYACNSRKIVFSSLFIPSPVPFQFVSHAWVTNACPN